MGLARACSWVGGSGSVGFWARRDEGALTDFNGGPSELGRRVKGVATDFVCWAESSRDRKWGKGQGKRKGFFLFSESIFVKREI
jgi:hypothetical protein